MRFHIALIAMTLLLGPASAQEARPFVTQTECLKAAFDLSTSAEERNLAEETLDKVDELLAQMEAHCDANQLDDAMTVASDIRSLVQGQ